MENVLAIVLFSILFLVVLLFVPTLMTRRAVIAVIRIFRRSGALNAGSAMPAAELGLAPLSFGQRIMRMRDYKPRALDLLVNVEVVQLTEEGKIFLSEEKLLQSGIEKK